MFYGILNETSILDKLPDKFDLKKVYKDSKKIAKADKFTVMFQEECDYKQEIDNIKYMIKHDKWVESINKAVDNDYPDIMNGAKNISYYVEYYTNDECTHYVVFKCMCKDHEAYGKYIGVMIKRLESVKLLSY